MADRSGHPSNHVVVCLPDIPERRLMGDLPPEVEVVLVPEAPGPVPDLAGVDLIVPTGRIRPALIEAMREPGRLRVIQTLSAGVDWLVGHVPEHVTVHNARGVYDGPLAEWVVGAILAFQRGFIRARDAQAAKAWTSFEPDELAGRRVVILGFGSIGAAVAERLQPFGVDVTGVARTRRADALGLEAIDDLLPRAGILIDLLPLTRETTGFLDARRLALLPDGALLVNAGRGRTVDNCRARCRAPPRAAAGGARRDRSGAPARGARAVDAAERAGHPPYRW